ncbi:hypothetical protein [Streptomyces sp. NPDC002685]
MDEVGNAGGERLTVLGHGLGPDRVRTAERARAASGRGGSASND